MRTSLVPQARPRISHLGSVRGHTNPPATRRPTFSLGRRKLTFSDAFPILLGPVLATAFIADSAWKDKKRGEWDRKLAQLEEEIERLRQRELETWTKIQTRSVRTGARQQHRHYSSTARLYSNGAEDVENGDTEILHVENDGGMQQTELSSSQDGNAAKDQTEMRIRKVSAQSTSKSLSGASPENLRLSRSYERQVAEKLALDLIIHLRKGRSHLSRQIDPLDSGADLYFQHFDALTLRLAAVNKNLDAWKRKTPLEPVSPNLLKFGPYQCLEKDLEKLTSQCAENLITVPELVQRYAHSISYWKAAPSARAYRSLLECFAKRNFPDLASYTIGALRSSRQPLDNNVLKAITMYYGKSRDSARFSSLLQLLSKKDFVLSRVDCSWRTVSVNNVRVPVPIHGDADLLTALIRTAFQCGMVQKAEAWSSYLFRMPHQMTRYAYFFRTVLDFCAEQNDWNTGERWLHMTIKWVAYLAQESPEDLFKVIMRILNLCVACDQRDLYERILQAAVAAGIQVEEIGRARGPRPRGVDLITARVKIIVKDWISVRNSNSTYEKISGVGSIMDQVARFQTTLAQHDSSLQRYVGMTKIDHLLKHADEAAGSGRSRLTTENVVYSSQADLYDQLTKEYDNLQKDYRNERRLHAQEISAYRKANNDLIRKFHAENEPDDELPKFDELSKVEDKISTQHLTGFTSADERSVSELATDSMTDSTKKRKVRRPTATVQASNHIEMPENLTECTRAASKDKPLVVHKCQMMTQRESADVATKNLAREDSMLQRAVNLLRTLEKENKSLRDTLAQQQPEAHQQESKTQQSQPSPKQPKQVQQPMYSPPPNTSQPIQSVQRSGYYQPSHRPLSLANQHYHHDNQRRPANLTANISTIPTKTAHTEF